MSSLLSLVSYEAPVVETQYLTCIQGNRLTTHSHTQPSTSISTFSVSLLIFTMPISSKSSTSLSKRTSILFSPTSSHSEKNLIFW